MPPNRRVMDASACKFRNNVFCTSSAIPMPVSSPKHGMSPSSRPVRRKRPRSGRRPAELNFTALPVRFSSTWRTRPPSPIKLRGISGAQQTTISIDFSACAAPRNRRPPPHNGFQIERALRLSFPASIFENRECHSRIVEQRFGRLWTVCGIFLLLISGVSRSRAVMPRTPFIRVRIMAHVRRNSGGSIRRARRFVLPSGGPLGGQAEARRLVD